ncbi:hypothetical protein KW795_00930 [Candidatus Microgenomates bacterium]|nr:hypothetical protein [Candidatus Microgenomates bacterium]
MQNLASLFVTLVTVVNTLAPTSNINKILSFNPLSKASQAVLSETDESNTQSAGDSGTVTSTTGTKETSSTPKPSGEPTKILSDIKKARELRQKTIETTKQKREEAQTKREAARDEFKEKLQTIKDTKKQQIVSKIDENISTLNQKWVDKWNEVLTRLTEILAKIQTRTDKAQANGKDVAQITAAIADTQTAISTAQTAVDAQASKTYTITITSETGLGTDVKTTINSFHNDIKNTRESVEAARKAVGDVLKTLKTIVGEDSGEKQG